MVIIIQTAGIDQELVKSRGKLVHYSFDPELIHLFDENSSENLMK